MGIDRPYTYTIVVKSQDSQNIVRQKLAEYGVTANFEVVKATSRLSGNEIICLIHTIEDSSQFGIALSKWLCEMPYDPPFSDGTLLWYR